MKYARIIQEFYSTPWALERGKFETVRNFLARKQAGDTFTETEIRLASSQKKQAVALPGSGGTGVICVFGMLCQRLSALDDVSVTGCSTEALGNILDEMAANKGISLIVIVFDSPGGSVSGIDELGRKIASIRARKSIICVADSCAASAAFWLASQGSELVVTNGGMIGSVGVLAAHQDISEQEKKDGIKTTLVSSGPYKTEGSPYGPLSSEARGQIQDMCDHFYGMFVSAVARGRGVTEAKVKSSFGGGRMMTAVEAVRVGAADRVATLQQVLSEAAGGGGGKGAKAEALAASMCAMRARALQVTRECGVAPAAAGVYVPAASSPPPSSASHGGHFTLEAARRRAAEVERECAGSSGSRPAPASAPSPTRGRPAGLTSVEEARRRAREVERECRGD